MNSLSTVNVGVGSKVAPPAIQEEINHQALIRYAQSLIDTMLNVDEKRDEVIDNNGNVLNSDGHSGCLDSFRNNSRSKALSSLQQARLIVKFLYLKNKPLKNRQFFEHFYSEQ